MIPRLLLSKSRGAPTVASFRNLRTLVWCLWAFCGGSSAHASHQGCAIPGRHFPATPIPECVTAIGQPTVCTPGTVRLWTSRLVPASSIPLHRDSTDRVAGTTIPGAGSGHELFSSVALVEESGRPVRLYVSYNAGLQAWDLATQPGYAADPRLLAGEDGWDGDFLYFPPVGEQLNFCEDISAVNTGPDRDLIGLACKGPAGVSFWRWTPQGLRQLYQDTGTDGRQIRITDGAAYVGTTSGVAVYDVSAADSLPSPCLDNTGSAAACPVYRGTFDDGSRIYVDAQHDPVRDSTWVSASGGISTRLELWEITTPGNPASATRRWSGPVHAQGSALIPRGGDLYLAWVDEPLGDGTEALRIGLVDCPNGYCDVTKIMVPIDLSGYPTAVDFLTYSESGFLYYGFGTGQLRGFNLERLWSLESWPSLLDLAADGQTYTDPCNGAGVGYWSHQYSENVQGLNNVNPRIARVSSDGLVYRAAATVLDVHKVIGREQIFSDDFESGDLGKWSERSPP